MRQDQSWNSHRYYRPRKEKLSVWRQLKSVDKNGRPLPLRGNVTTTRWAGKKTAMIRVAKGIRYYQDAAAVKQQLTLSGTTDAKVRGYSISIPVEKTRKYQEYLEDYKVYTEKLKKYHMRLATHRGMAGDLNINQTRGMPVEPREPTRPLKLRYYSVYAREGHQFGPKMPRM